MSGRSERESKKSYHINTQAHIARNVGQYSEKSKEVPRYYTRVDSHISTTMLVHSGYSSGNHTPSFVPAYKPFSETLNKRDATTKQIRDNFLINENLATFKSSDSASDPPIDWIPRHSSYINRSQRRLRQGGLTKALPAGFPARVESPLAWTASELKKEEYTVVLSEEEILEIERGLRDFKGEYTMKIIWRRVLSPSTLSL